MHDRDIDHQGIVRVAAGASHTVALKSDGTAWAWGYNVAGQLGDGTRTNRRTPVQVKRLTRVTSVAAGAGPGNGRKARGAGASGPLYALRHPDPARPAGSGWRR